MELLERDSALQELAGLWDSARSSPGRIALVSGEAGIGKSSLVERFRDQHSANARVLWGACDALFTPRPLGPFHDIAGETAGDRASGLARLLKEGSNRPAIFSACLHELQAQPTIVVIEDIHWADEATLDLLKYVGRRIRLTRSLLLVTYRDDELNQQHPLRLLLGDLATSPAVRRIVLTPLSLDSVLRLVGERPVDAKSLHEQTGGNPFFVTEVLAAGKEGVPPTVRDAVLARAARLSLSGRAVLNAAAVAGPRIEPWLLAEVTQAEAGAVSESLDMGMLRAQGSGAASSGPAGSGATSSVLAFRHELARQAILDSIAPHQRLFLHQAVLDALKASALTRTDVSRLAHHAAAAGDVEAILTYAPAAAEAAQATGMFRTAASLWSLAIRYSSELPAVQRAAFYAAFGAAAKDNPDRTEAIDAHREAIALAKEGGDLLLAGNSLSRLAVMLLMEGETAEAVRAVDEALGMLEPLEPGAPLAAAHKTRAFLHLICGENEQAVARARLCHEVAAHLESAPLHIEAYHALGICSLPLNHAQGCDYLEKSLELLLEEKAYWGAGSVYADLNMTYIDVYQLQRAEELIAAGLQITAEHDLDLSWLVIRAWQAILLVYRGRWPEAEAIAKEIIARPDRMEVFRVPALVALARLRVRRGEGGWEDLLDEALELSMRVNNHQRLGVVYIARAEAAQLSLDSRWPGDRDATLHEGPNQNSGGTIYQIAIDNRQPGFAAELAYWRWRAGDDVETYDWMVKPFTLEIAGEWRAAAAAWEELGCPYEQARALADGDEPAQLAALEIFDRLGARPAADALRQQMRAAGAQSVPRGPRSATRANPFGLTPRQMEILELLVEDLTNSEIADRLHLSPKTVDHHVSAVLARLDVGSRHEAAEMARQQLPINSTK